VNKKALKSVDSGGSTVEGAHAASGIPGTAGSNPALDILSTAGVSRRDDTPRKECYVHPKRITPELILNRVRSAKIANYCCLYK